MSQLKWDQLAETVIHKLGRVKAGESVVIAIDTTSDLDLAYAYLSAALRAGTDASLVMSRYRFPKEVEVAKVLEAAFMSADVVFGLCRSSLSEVSAVRRARVERGTRFLLTSPALGDYLYEAILGIDYDRMLENAKRISELLRQTKRVRVVDELGTNVQFDLAGNGRPIIYSAGAVGQPGDRDHYPGAVVSVAPLEDSINGMIVADGSISSEGILIHPVRITMEQGKITTIKGGMQAERWHRGLESTGDPQIYRLVHFTMGLNPRARLSGDMVQDERLLGGVNFGFGSQDAKFGGALAASPYHTDIVLTSPSVYFDDLLITHKNRLNKELGLHEL